ncbi:MAG: alpha/beta hydrolase [Pseudoxanthomonas sp.]
MPSVAGIAPRATRIFLLGLLAACCIGATWAADREAAARTGNWRIETPERALDTSSGIRETVWQQSRPPGGDFDRIRLHRYHGGGKSSATLLYLPGTNMNGVVANTDEAHNLWLYLAACGIEVFVLDYRTHAIPAETPMENLGALRQWDTATFVVDIESAATLARNQSRRKKLFVAGFSRGGYLAYAHALAHPQNLAGLVILDAGFKNHAPTGQYDAAAAMQKLQASGAWASDVGGSRGWASRQQLMQAVAVDPNAKSPSPDYATAGDMLAHVLQTSWGNGGLANPEGGASKPQVLATLLQGYDRYYPMIQDIEGKSIADHADDPRTPIDDHWGDLRVPVIAFASTGLGKDWTQNVVVSANGSGSNDVSVHVLDGYGHLDVMVGEGARDDVYERILEWVRQMR